MHFQRPGPREALVALREGTHAGRLMGPVVAVLHHRLWLPLPPAAVVHEMGLQVPLAAKPDSTRLAREDVLWRDTGKGTKGTRYQGMSSTSIFMPKDKELWHRHALLRHFHSSDSQSRVKKAFPTKSWAAAYRRVGTTRLVPFLKGKQEHWTICLQKPPCRAEPR